MYIIYNNQNYPNVRRTRLHNSDVLFSGESLTDIGDVSGEIITFRNDGFEIVRDNTEDYLRTVVIGGTIRLTNQPEPPMEEEPEIIETGPSLEDRVTVLENEMEILTGVSE